MKSTSRDFTNRTSVIAPPGITTISRTVLACLVVMTGMVFCGCDSSPSISNTDRKDPKKFAEFIATEFAKGNYKPLEKYASYDRKDMFEKRNARVKAERKNGNTEAQTVVEELEESFKKTEKTLGKVVSYGVYSMTPDKRYANSGREAMMVKYWVIREHLKLTDFDRSWLCTQKDSEEECKKKRCLGQFLVVREHDGMWYIEGNV